MTAHQTACPNCHQPVAAGLQSCAQCGSPLAATAQQPMPQTPLPDSGYPHTPQRGKKSNQTIIIVSIIGAFLLLLVVGVVLFMFFNGNSDDNKNGDDSDEASSSVDEESDDQDEEGNTDEESDDQDEGGNTDEESDDQDEDGDTDEESDDQDEDGDTDEEQILDTPIDVPDESNYEHLNAYMDEKYDRCSDIRAVITLANDIPYSVRDCGSASTEHTRHGFEVMKADTNREGLLEIMQEEGYFECINASEEGYLAVIGDGFALHSWIIYGRDENLELGTAEYIDALNDGTRAESKVLEEEGFEVEIVNTC